MAGRAKENLPGGSLKYLFIYLKIRMFKCSYPSFSQVSPFHSAPRSSPMRQRVEHAVALPSPSRLGPPTLLEVAEQVAAARHEKAASGGLYHLSNILIYVWQVFKYLISCRLEACAPNCSIFKYVSSFSYMFLPFSIDFLPRKTPHPAPAPSHPIHHPARRCGQQLQGPREGGT